MDPEASVPELVLAFVRPRVRVVGGAFVAGVGVAVVGVGALVVAGWSVLGATQLVFVLGTLAFGFGLLGWSGSVMSGRSVEVMQDHLDAGTNWTEARSRLAMARVGGFGAGAMLATGVAEALLLGL